MNKKSEKAMKNEKPAKSGLCKKEQKNNMCLQFCAQMFSRVFPPYMTAGLTVRNF
jgi:hypothetical protein